MARNIWDDIAESPGSEEAETRVRSSTPPSFPGGDFAPRRRAAALPWLLFGLAGVGLGASVVHDLDNETRHRVEVTHARDEAADLRRNLFATEDRLASVEKERSKVSQEAKALVQKSQTDGKLIADLQKQLDSHDGDVAESEGRISVNLVDQILFKSGEAEISPRGKQVLAKVGGVLKQASDKQILIGGHTDDRPIHTPQFPSNWELSTARAVNVVRFLQEQAGVDPSHLTAAGYSEFHPRSKRDKSKNRRIEILLLPEIKPGK